MAGFKIFISQAMTGRKESEVRHERWLYYTLAKLRWGSSNGGNNPELINQFDVPDDMPTFEGLSTEDREAKKSLWLLGRSIQMMRDADIVIIVGNPIESKGMMVEYEVLRQYNKYWWVHTDKDMIEWAKQHHPHEFIDIMHTYTHYCSNNDDELVVKNEEKEQESTSIVETSHGLITNTELHDIMYEYISPEIDKCTTNGSAWYYGSFAGFFYWSLCSSSSYSSVVIGSSFIKENDEIIGFDIYNTYGSNEKCVNIKIRKDRIEFIEDSKFCDFNRDFMHGLFEKIKEYMTKKEKEETLSDKADKVVEAMREKHKADEDLKEFLNSIDSVANEMQEKSNTDERFFNPFEDFSAEEISALGRCLHTLS